MSLDSAHIFPEIQHQLMDVIFKIALSLKLAPITSRHVEVEIASLTHPAFFSGGQNTHTHTLTYAHTPTHTQTHTHTHIYTHTHTQ